MFLQFYGLNEQPFGVTPDPRFLYMGPAQQEAFSSLVYGIETGRGFMALIASPGLGKTTMLHRLMERLQGSARTAFLFQTFRNPEEFLRGLLTDLEIEPAGQDLGELQRQLGDVLIEEARSGKRIVVAIDEAQNLDDKVLEMVRMISNFETPDSKLLQIVLVGQPQLADKLSSPHLEQLRQRVSIITHFPPLDGNDVPMYIDHRLRTAGYRGGELFTRSALRLVAVHSKGIPRNINNLCFHALSLGFAKNQKKIDDAIVREVITDLSLEDLGTSRRSAPENVPAPEGIGWVVQDSQKERGSGFKREWIPVAENPRPIERHEDFALDAVNLSSHLLIADEGNRYSPRLAADGRVLVPREQKQSVRPVFWVALILLLAGLWAAPYLKSGLASVENFVAGGDLSPKRQEVVTPPGQATPNTNLASDETITVENSLSPRTDAKHTAVSPDSQVPATSVATSTLDPAANAAVLGAAPTTSPRPGESGNLADKTPSTVQKREYTPGSGRLIVESNVGGAQITLNGRSDPKWKTPHLFFLPSGTYVVSVSAGGYTTSTKRLYVDAERERWMVAELEDRDGGVYTVDTDPPGMPVFIDGKAYGLSRVEAVLRPGWHESKVIPEPGHEPLTSRFHLGPGQALTRRIRVASPMAQLGRPGPNPAVSAAVPQRGIP